MLGNKQKLLIAHKLLTALAFLHANDVIHRDIKTDNILLDENMDPVLADFSLAKIFDNKCLGTTHTPGIGTASYKAPEVYWETGYGLKADVFALGVVFLELFNGLMKVDRDKAALKYIEDVSSKLTDRPIPSLLKSMLHPDPEKRVSSLEALKMPVFQQLEMKELKRVANKVTRINPKVTTHERVKRKGRKKRQRVVVERLKEEDVDDFDVLFELLEYTNPLTKAAAKVYYETSNQSPEYCIILAGKLYEEELLSTGAVKDFIEDFDIECYARAEMAIFKSMEYCLFI